MMKRTILTIALASMSAISFAQFNKLTTIYNLGSDFSGTSAQRVSDLAVIGNDIYYVGRTSGAASSNATLGKISGWQSATSGANVAVLGTSVPSRGTRLEAYNGNLFFGLNMGDTTTQNIQYITTSGTLITGGAGVLSDGIITQAENSANLLQGMSIDTSGVGTGPIIGGVQLGSGGFKGVNITTGASYNINPGAGPTGNRRDTSFFANGDYLLDQDGVIRLVQRTGAQTAGVPGGQLGATGISGSFATVHAINALSGVNSNLIAYNVSGNQVALVDTAGGAVQTLTGAEGGALAWGTTATNYASWNDGTFTYLAVSSWDGSFGNRVDVYRTAVPEPATWAALGAGLVAVTRRRRKS